MVGNFEVLQGSSSIPLLLNEEVIVRDKQLLLMLSSCNGVLGAETHIGESCFPCI